LFLPRRTRRTLPDDLVARHRGAILSIPAAIASAAQPGRRPHYLPRDRCDHRGFADSIGDAYAPISGRGLLSPAGARLGIGDRRAARPADGRPGTADVTACTGVARLGWPGRCFGIDRAV